MTYSLPPLDKKAIDLPHFPTKHQAFIFRAWEYADPAKIAKILQTTVENTVRAANDMGLSAAPESKWKDRGYITIIRRMWHILPYSQLLELLEMNEQELALILKEEDFLDVKLSKKPICEPVRYRELTPDEERRTEEIKKTVKSVDLGGKRAFEFEFDVPKINFEGEPRFKTRMLYAFSGLYQHAFDVDSEVFLSDEQLLAYQKLGVNGIWTQGVLSELSEFVFDPSLSEGYEKRLEQMRKMSERLDKFGIKLYLYINEPRYMPISFFERFGHIKGHVRDKTNASLCTSTNEVREYIHGAIENICKKVPLLGGFFTITRSENQTNCYSHSGDGKNECLCPRCSQRSVPDVISELINTIASAAHGVSRDIKVFAWSWAWREFSEQIIQKLSKDVILLVQSELDVPFEIGGVKGRVLDYSMSIQGPGELAKREWRAARDSGHEVGAKMQINTTWEASTVPAIPVAPLIDKHMSALEKEGVQHVLLSWTLGGYPCRNIAAAARYFYDKCDYSLENEPLYKAQVEFSRAFKEFPFHINVLYYGPQNAGPSNLLYPNPTGYAATMTCFAYDDLEKWRSIYPIDVFEDQFDKLCSGWERGLALIDENDNCEVAVMARAAYCIYRSSLNQIRFLRARDEKRYLDAADLARQEEKVARLMLKQMNLNASIGYEASNHYYFSKGQLVEKIVNCRYVAKYFDDEVSKNV